MSFEYWDGKCVRCRKQISSPKRYDPKNEYVDKYCDECSYRLDMDYWTAIDLYEYWYGEPIKYWIK